jgi:hypothetical protein
MGTYNKRKKTCNKCKLTLPIDSFYADAKNVDGFKGTCKKCVLFAQNQLRRGERVGRKRNVISTSFDQRSVEFDIYTHFKLMDVKLTDDQIRTIKAELDQAIINGNFWKVLDKQNRIYGANKKKWKVDMLEIFRQEREIQLFGKVRMQGGGKEQVMIEQLDLRGNHIAFYDSPRDASIALRGDRKSVSMICNCAGARCKSAFGFIFRYVDQ